MNENTTTDHKEDSCLDKDPETKRKLNETLIKEDDVKNENQNKKAKTLSINLMNNTDEKDEHVQFKPELMTKDEECFECQQVYRDPSRSDLTMYLHALSYKVYF
jgi:hypothetical protein